MHLYPRLLGPAFDELPAHLQQFHLRLPNAGRGHARIVRASRGLAAVGAFVARFPPTARRVPLELEVSECRGGERWHRKFGPSLLVTTQHFYNHFLIERAGPASMWFELAWERSRVVFRSQRVTMLGVPLPSWFRPRMFAIVRATDCGWVAKIIVRSPWGAVLVRYRVEVKPSQPESER